MNETMTAAQPGLLSAEELAKYRAAVDVWSKSTDLIQLRTMGTYEVSKCLSHIDALTAENARLREVLALAKSDLFDLVDPSGDIRFRPAIDRIDSALKGGTE